MCQNYLRWKLGLSGKSWAFRENECANGTTGVKNRAFVETQCAEGTLSKFGHFGEKISIGLLGKMSVQKDLKLKLGLLGKIGALLRKFGHFGKKMGLLGKKCAKGTLW